MCHVTRAEVVENVEYLLGTVYCLENGLYFGGALSTPKHKKIERAGESTASINMKNYLKIVFIACITILCKFHQGLTSAEHNNNNNSRSSKSTNDNGENDNEDAHH